MEDIKSVLMPRQHLQKTLDPVFSKSVDEVHAELRALKEPYVEIVLNNRYPDDTSVIECLDINE